MIYELLLWFVIWYLVMAFAEYLIHKHTMHKRKRWLPFWIFKHHAIDHHRDDRQDLNIDLPVYMHLMIGSPLIVASYLLFGWVSTVPLLATFFYHSYVWTHMHRAIHDLENHWITKTRYYKRAKKHHLDHHDKPTKNFGVVFLWTDYIFRTKIK
tara:strand:+ start:238 stop:699 length:462 start_codon:yes stop_codon:yes gene_type:complete